MAFIDNIVKFHTFSKSTVRPDLTLGEAVNPSGHTVTSKQVRTDDIPAFINSFKDNKTDALAWAAENVDAYVRHNDILYYGSNFNMGFDKPTCLIRVAKQEVEGKLVDLPKEQHTWVDFDLLYTDRANNVLRTTLKNADEKGVIAIHKGAKICYVHKDNNASTNSNENSAFIKKADGTFLDHFIAPTDQFVGGQPSLGYGLCLFKENYNSGKAFSEGESTYISNAFAGLIHFMTTRTESSDKSKNYEIAGFSVNCFEYIGDKLDKSISNIRKDVQDIIGTTMEGVVASVGTDDAATNAGISIIDTNDSGAGSKTSPQIAFTEGSITDKETKLVSGKTVKTYVDAVSTEQKIWNLNQFFNENCTRDDIHWIREVLEYKSSSGDQLVYFQQADKYTTNKVLDTSNKNTGEDAVTRHKAVANAWINYVKQNGHAPFELVFKKDSYRINEIIRHMFAQLDKDAGFTYLSDGSISKRCMKPGLSVKYVTVLNTGESYDPFGSLIDLDLGIVDDATNDSDGTKFYPTFTISTWHGKTRFNSGDSILNGNEPESIRTAGANSFLNATNDSFMRAYNWTYTVNEQEHKFIVDAIKSGGSISKAIADAKKAGTDAMAEAKAKVSSVTGPTTGLVTVSTNASTKAVTVSVSEKLASKDDITLTGVTLNGAAVTPSNKVANITAIEGVTTTAVNGVALAKDGNNVKVAVTSAGYTAATGDNTVGTWTNKDNVVTGTAVDTRVADAIKEAKAYSNSLHTTSVTYHVTDTLPTVPAGKEEEYKGRIYLVLTGIDGVVAADGDRIEYMYVQENGVWGWEQIGTTTADLSGYAKTADLNATNVGSGAVKVSQTNGKVSSVTVATEALVTDGAIKASVTDANALVKAGDALEAIKLAKPENYVASVTGYTAEGSQVTTTQGAAVKVLDDRGTSVTADDLWGNKVTMDASGNITVTDNYIANWLDKNGAHNFAWQGDSSITAVENNKVYAGDTFKANIQTEKIKAGYNMFASSSLTSFNGDLSNLVDGSYMFNYNPNFTSFNSNLGSLVKALNMFEYTNITSFDVDLSNLVNGREMFAHTNLTSFSSNLSSLVDGEYMFSYCTNLTSFGGDLSNLVNGNGMFSSSGLTTFRNDLSNLVNGSYMFFDTPLNSFKNDLSNLVDGSYMFSNCTDLTSFGADLGNLVDGSKMFYLTNIASFNSDLSNLRDGSYMFKCCANLASFDSDLSNLILGDNMFENCTNLTSFGGDLNSLISGYQMFASSSLTSFNGDLSNLITGSYMFFETDLTSFNGDLSSLVNGFNMFTDTNLDIDSIETICDVLPNWIENKLMTYSYDSSTDSVISQEWDAGPNLDPLRYIMYGGHIGPYTRDIDAAEVKTITIRWSDISVLTEAERKKVLDLMTETANEKGWTFITNREIDPEYKVSPTQVMAADGTIQRYTYVIKVEADEKTAKFVDADGKYWNVHTAECIIGPNVKYWELFATKEDAITTWGLSEYTYVEPTEEA